MDYDPTGHFRVNFQQKEYDGGAGGVGVGITVWGLEYLLEKGNEMLVSLGALLILTQKLREFEPENGQYYVYALFDEDGYVQYVGRTKDPKARANAHRNNPSRENLDFRIVGANLNYLQARGLEQALMLYCHTIQKGNHQKNQINGISLNNNYITDYLIAAEKALGYSWNQVSNEVLCWLGQ